MTPDRIRTLFPDPRWEVPRYFSNAELRHVGRGFHGKVANVSGWRDEDKEGGHYRDYFPNATEYWITNYKAEARGWQGDIANEIYLDLEQPLDAALQGRFDVVFNHTVLEHVFDVFTAFRNLCLLSADAVVAVVPFIQEQHGEYGDYWRFTPLCLRRLLGMNGFELAYLTYNDGAGDAVYIFVVGVRDVARWTALAQHPHNRAREIDRIYIGRKVVKRPPAPVRALRSLLLRSAGQG